MTDQTTTETPAPETQAPEKTNKRQMTFAILENGNIQASFGEGIDPLVLDLSTVPEAVQLAAITEGLISRTRGYTANLVDADRTPAKLAERVAKAFANLQAGVWKIERGEGAGETFTIDEEAAHVFRIKRGEKKNEPYTKTLAETAKEWGALTEDQRKTAKTVPLFQLARAEVKARRDAEKMEKLAKAVAEDTTDF